MSLCWSLLAILVMEKLWKLRQIRRFFREQTVPTLPIGLQVDLIQPVVSGDPHLRFCLQNNLEQATRLQVQRILVVEQGDQVALELCGELSEQFGAQLVQVGPPPQGVSPKTHKLKAGLKVGEAEFVAFLDDDTCLPDFGLDEAVSTLLDSEVGVVHGLPYYRSFDNLWSAMVACFVNAQSLLTYIPYLRLTPPVSINGMFYAMRRSTLEQMGGLEAIERQLCDDFAIAKAIRGLGLKVVQSRVRHPIRTHVQSARDYHQLIKRWFVFPSISILRQLPWNELLLFWLVCVLPTSLPSLLTVSCLIGSEPLPAILGWLLVDRVNRHLDSVYLNRATPRRWFPLMLVTQLFLPFQILLALIGGSQIQWRGQAIEVHTDGSFIYLDSQS